MLIDLQGEENIAVLATKLERSDEIAKTMVIVFTCHSNCSIWRTHVDMWCRYLCDIPLRTFCSFSCHVKCGILDSFNERLHKLEDTIRPIHDETTKLKRLQGSIPSTPNVMIWGCSCVGQSNALRGSLKHLMLENG